MNNKWIAKGFKTGAGAVALSMLSSVLPAKAEKVSQKNSSSELAYKQKCNGVLPDRVEYAINADTGEVLVNRGGERVGEIGSLSKVASLAFIQSLIEDGEVVKADMPVKITTSILNIPGMQWIAAPFSKLGRKEHWNLKEYNIPWTLEQLSQGAAQKSYNDLMTAGAIAVERALNPEAKENNAADLDRSFAKRVTAFFKDKGLEINLENSTGLPNPNSGASLSTVAKIMRYVAERFPKLANMLGQKKVEIKGAKVESSNPLFDAKNNPFKVNFGKTGYTCAAGHALAASVTLEGHGNVISVTKGALSKPDRLAQHMNLLQEAFAVIEIRNRANEKHREIKSIKIDPEELNPDILKIEIMLPNLDPIKEKEASDTAGNVAGMALDY